MRKVLLGLAAAVLMAGSSAAYAFECPTHFAEADAEIEAAAKAAETVSDEGARGRVHTLIDDAKMWLGSARHNHNKPAAGKYDHARAIAKAEAAIGFAEAAQILAANSK